MLSLCLFWYLLCSNIIILETSPKTTLKKEKKRSSSAASTPASKPSTPRMKLQSTPIPFKFNNTTTTATATTPASEVSASTFNLIAEQLAVVQVNYDKSQLALATAQEEDRANAIKIAELSVEVKHLNQRLAEKDSMIEWFKKNMPNNMQAPTPSSPTRFNII